VVTVEVAVNVSPSGETSICSPMLEDRIGDWAIREEIHELEGTSHSFTVESRDVERIFLPRDMIPVEDMERVCPRRVRAGAMRVLAPSVVSDEVSDKSAGRIESAKSPPAERSTREEGKN
jgi:hypothetical protein